MPIDQQKDAIADAIYCLLQELDDVDVHDTARRVEDLFVLDNADLFTLLETPEALRRVVDAWHDT